MSTKERPILFSGPMVRAILEGKKTQTRRLVKPPPPRTCQTPLIWSDGWSIAGHVYHCPYGKPGDRLWVRETWAENAGSAGGIIYRADFGDKCGGVATLDLKGQEWTHCVDRWRPSIFMPRWASRITLEITGVRIERLQHISEEDALAEGSIGALNNSIGDNWSAREAFAAFWQSIHGADSWDINPWVWVVEFQHQEA